MRGHAKHRAAAILHQHEIGDVDRQAPIRVEGMLRSDPQPVAQLFLRLQLGGRRPALAAQLDKGGGLWVGVRSGAGDRVISGNRDKACAENRVGTRRKHLNCAAIRQRKRKG